MIAVAMIVMMVVLAWALLSVAVALCCGRAFSAGQGEPPRVSVRGDLELAA